MLLSLQPSKNESMPIRRGKNRKTCLNQDRELLCPQKWTLYFRVDAKNEESLTLIQAMKDEYFRASVKNKKYSRRFRSILTQVEFSCLFPRMNFCAPLRPEIGITSPVKKQVNSRVLLDRNRISLMM